MLQFLRPASSLALLATLSLWAGSVLLLQAQAPRAQDTFVDVIDVRVVEVEVVVTDRDGERVLGLTPEDFRLKVDGRETPIDYFSEVRDHTAATGATTPEGEESTVPPAPALSTQGNSLLVFVDDYFTERRYRDALFKRLLRDLEALGPRDRMAIVRYAGRELEVLSSWTSSKESLRQVLEDTRKLKPGELTRQAQFLGLTGGSEETYAEQARLNALQIEKVVNAASVTLRSFSQAPGRKLFVLISSGWPYDYSATIDTTGALFPAVQRYSTIDVIRPVADVANLLGYTIYPLQLALTGGGPDASQAEADDGADFDLGASVERGSLRFLAEETGGSLMAKAIVKSTLPLDWVREDVRSFYQLGFSQEMEQDGGRHDIEVEVLRDDLRVRHRTGFLDLSRRTQATMDTEALLLLGETAGSPLEVAVTNMERARRRVLRVTLELRIPMDRITMLPRGGGVYASNLELRVIAVDERGDRSEVPVEPVELHGPEPPPGSYATYEVPVELRRTEQTLAISLYDVLSGELFSAMLPIEP